MKLYNRESKCIYAKDVPYPISLLDLFRKPHSLDISSRKRTKSRPKGFKYT